MNTDNTRIKVLCPKCNRIIETTLPKLRKWPLVTCHDCGHEFYADVRPLVDAAQE